MAKISKKNDHQLQLEELTADLQRQRADFENYRKRVDTEKSVIAETARNATIMRLLPIIDTIERATHHIPADLADNSWAQGIRSLNKNLEKSLAELGLERILATPGTIFNPTVHEAVMLDDDSTGDQEVIVEELRAGYKYGGVVIRPSMVKVARQPA